MSKSNEEKTESRNENRERSILAAACVVVLALLIVFSVMHRRQKARVEAAKLENKGPKSHDFEVDGIFYRVLSKKEKTVAVSFEGASYDMNPNRYKGNLVIPAAITADDATYRVITIGWYAFYNCDSLLSVEIPPTVRYIRNSAFADCEGLTKVVIPRSLTTIEDKAFSFCGRLNAAVIPDSVKWIGNRVFAFCDNLERVTIPSSVRTIGDDAFSGCRKLQDVVCRAVMPPECKNDAFDGVDRKLTLHVPPQSVNVYREASVWKEFETIVPITDIP